MIIFKKVIKSLKQINREMILYNEDKELLKELKKKKELLSVINEFMLKYEWISHSKTKEKLACFIESDFNYMRVVEEFGVTYESARASISQLGRLFEREIGIGIVDSIMDGDLSIAEEELYENINDYTGLFVSELKPLLPKGSLNDLISLKDCRRELSYLQFYTTKRLKDGFKGLESEKLSHIIAILEDKKGIYASEQEAINGFLRGDVKKWENFENLIK